MRRKKCIIRKSTDNGFTLIELIVIITIMGILTTIAIPVFSKWLPDYALRRTVMALYSDMHLAKIKAIKGNSVFRIEFLPGGADLYRIVDPDGTIVKTVNLSAPDEGYSICYGCGNATKKATTSGGTVPEDGISYTSNNVSFNPRGFGKMGYVYLTNSKGTAYAIGTWASGIVILKKWNKATGSWEQ